MKDFKVYCMRTYVFAIIIAYIANVYLILIKHTNTPYLFVDLRLYKHCYKNVIEGVSY